MARSATGAVCLRLLLDEHFSPEIARQLRRLGHDVIAVKEHDRLAGRTDYVQFASSTEERRAIVTKDLGDYRPLLQQAMAAGQATYGLVCVPARFPLTRRAVGAAVRALDQLLRELPDDDAAANRGGEVWLS